MFLRKIANRHWIIRGVLIVGLFTPLFLLSIHYQKQIENAEYETKRIQEDAEIKLEVKRRNASRTKSQPNSQPSIVNSESQETIGIDETGSINDSSVPETTNVIDPGDAVITQGPHKGMTVREYEKHKAYMAEKRKIMDQYKAHIKKEIEYADNLLASSKKERNAILSVFKNLSPEQLENVRKHLIRNTTQDEERINNFFNDVNNYDKASTQEEFNREVQGIITYDQALDVVRRELDIENEAIDLQLKELNEKYPDQR